MPDWQKVLSDDTTFKRIMRDVLEVSVARCSMLSLNGQCTEVAIFMIVDHESPLAVASWLRADSGLCGKCVAHFLEKMPVKSLVVLRKVDGGIVPDVEFVIPVEIEEAAVGRLKRMGEDLDADRY